MWGCLELTYYLVLATPSPSVDPISPRMSQSGAQRKLSRREYAWHIE